MPQQVYASAPSCRGLFFYLMCAISQREGGTFFMQIVYATKSLGYVSDATIEYLQSIFGISEIMTHGQLRRNRLAVTPERRMLLAMLEGTFEDLRKYRFAKNFRGQKMFFDAVRHVLGAETTKDLFSFEHLCGHLDINVDWARDRAKHLIFDPVA